jgi:hypothetical protein
LGHLIVGEIELVHELLVGRSLFQSVEVHTVQVLNDGLLEREPIVNVVLQEHRNELELRDGGGPPATFAGDELIFVRLPFDGTHDDRLKDAELGDRRCERLETVVVEGFPRLKLIWSYRGHGNSPKRVGGRGLDRLFIGGGGALRDEGAQAFT